MSQSDQIKNPFGGAGNGTPDPKNPFQIVNEERPVGGSTPSPFGGEAGASPFGVADGAADKPVQLPTPGGSPTPEAPANPFGSKDAKPAESDAGAEPFGMPKTNEPGGFEMKGISASNTPVNQIGTAPIGGETSTKSDSFVSGSDNGFAKSKGESEPGNMNPGDSDTDFGNAGGVTPASQIPAMTPVPAMAEIKQLELRAIFGVDHELSRQEMMQRARTLPGIKNVSPISGDEVAALDTIKSCMANLGFGKSESILLSCPNGVIDFITYGTATLAVVHESDYAPGVRETLIIIARELDKI